MRSLFLNGPAGRLEALLNLPAESAINPTTLHAALLCHPHPKGGGTMHNKVVYNAMKALTSLGISVLRFNFRGVGASEGDHDHGIGEQDDVRSALDWLRNERGAPLLFCGFSFGSAVGMRVCCPEPEVAGLIALGLPAEVKGERSYEYPWLAFCAKPKLFVSGGADEYGPQKEVEARIAHAAGENEVHFVPGADHFFQSPEGPRLEAMQAHIRAWVLRNFTA